MEFGRLLSAVLICLMQGNFNLYINTRALIENQPGFCGAKKPQQFSSFFFVAHYVHISLFAFVSGCSSVNAQPNNPQPHGSSIFPSHTSFVSRGLKKNPLADENVALVCIDRIHKWRPRNYSFFHVDHPHFKGKITLNFVRANEAS